MRRLQIYLGEVVNQTFSGYMQMQRRAHSGNVSFHKQVEVVIANFTKMHSGTVYLYNKPMHLCLFDIKQKHNHTCSLLVEIYQNFETFKFFMKNHFARFLYICTIRHLLNILKLEPVQLKDFDSWAWYMFFQQIHIQLFHHYRTQVIYQRQWEQVNK